ncbi:MAG: hypothetical protein V2A63_00530 [Patescibacteria group bacterium]
MPPKIKNKTRRSRPAVRFTVRRIANRNPRNARNFRQFRQKLTRLTMGLIALGLIAGSLFLHGGQLKSDVVATTQPDQAETTVVAADTTASTATAVANTSATTAQNSASMNDKVCAADDLIKNFEDLTTQLANLSREFPDVIANLDFCGTGKCAAQDLVYKNENKIWQIEKDLTKLETDTTRAQTDFATSLAEKENGVFLCENESRCTAAEAALGKARECEKTFQKLNQLFTIRTDVQDKYSLVTAKGTRESAAVYVKKLMEDIFKNRDRVTENTKFYEQCVAASDASVCQKYVQKVKEANTNIAKSIEELGGLQVDLQDNLDKVEADIVALEIGRGDAQNTKENEGLGWCDQNLKNTKADLFTKLTAAAGAKTTYDNALQHLVDLKITLKASLQSETEEAAMHAAAEKQAAEEAEAIAAAEKAAAAKRAQAEMVFGFWTIIRNGF